MADSNVQLHWTDEQWNKVRQVVYEEARRARVAGNFLPLYGPLEADARFVAREVTHDPSDPPDPEAVGVTVSDSDTLRLTTLQVNVYLRGAQVADPELESALLAFRRAASLVARLEDDIMFRGQVDSNRGPPRSDQVVDETVAARAPAQTPDNSVRGGQRIRGLLDTINRPRATITGNDLVIAVSNAISRLERDRHFAPFACALSHEYFDLVQTPNPNSLVLPQDRILPFLAGGPLVRCSSLPPNTGLVVALSGTPIDLVVGTDISVGFLQVTPNPWFVFRVFEKVVLRIKQPGAIVPLAPVPNPNQRPRSPRGQQGVQPAPTPRAQSPGGGPAQQGQPVQEGQPVEQEQPASQGQPAPGRPAENTTQDGRAGQ
jgi:uncharacterized linocin/CFP29 family protein